MSDHNENVAPVPTPVLNPQFDSRTQIEVSAGLVFRNGLLLITQRLPDVHLGGLWEFPGGKRMPQESYEACLRRELMEELGIEVEVKELVEAITHKYPEKLVHLKFFHCGWIRNEPQTLGCHDFAWVGKSQLNNYAFPEADQRLLQKLLNTAELWA
ncbi:MAG: mutT [Pedosphaera sp.]|nr:mutT [Pedosphaera sp.]